MQHDQLISFKFLKEHNPQLDADVVATFAGNVVQVDLPSSACTDSLVATFETKHHAKLFVGKREQQSGVTANAFAGQVAYKVIRPDRTLQHYNVDALQSFPELDKKLTMLMQQYRIPGLSIAIARNEKLVFAKSYGYASKERKDPVHNASLFRIASISKPITAIAILKLVQDRKISLDDYVFGPNSILGNNFGIPPAGSAVSQITVQHLLNHTSGWTNEPTDPMLTHVSRSQKQIITEAVQGRQLKYKPGSTYSYSNLGYCILGRVIEKVTGKAYEEYVRTALLLPAGVESMVIGGSTAAQRLPEEVTYYQQEWNPYSLNISRMDAYGGWLATASDLMRLMVRIDRNPAKPDLIESPLLSQFYFGASNWFHSGSLPGSSAFITRLNDEYSLVMLANTRDNTDGTLFFKEFYYAARANIVAKREWTTLDLFEYNI
ncbi:serine hydrolase domain-containing protein [Pontibacter qinzhouensis]|uniref:serine hydrolase domain-containing protein n=1 Tax=Pontibacter qinzhouensis TaxID=2603253 RepID=UPI001650C44C|nr:serine hydrolase domain-containing protein [Pontibacter qinzhouensis]